MDLSLDAASTRANSNSFYKGSKAYGLSRLPTQLVKHLHVRKDEVTTKTFVSNARTYVAAKWNMTRITSVYEKGAKDKAVNYRLVNVMGPIAKLFSACLNMEFERVAQLNDCRTPTKVQFCRYHRLAN